MAWAGRTLRRLREKPLFWWNVALSAVTIWVLSHSATPVVEGWAADLPVRVLGMCLQLLGVLTVWMDLSDAAARFGRDGFVRGTLGWLRSIFEKPKTVYLEAAACVNATSFCDASLRRGVGPDATLEQRVAALEAKLGFVDAEIEKTKRDLEKRAAGLEGRVSALDSEHRSRMSGIERSLEDLAVGNHALLSFGAFWLGVGVVVSTFAPEMARLGQ